MLNNDMKLLELRAQERETQLQKKIQASSERKKLLLKSLMEWEEQSDKIMSELREVRSKAEAYASTPSVVGRQDQPSTASIKAKYSSERANRLMSSQQTLIVSEPNQERRNTRAIHAQTCQERRANAY